jgi:hypothetical protein
VNTQDALENAKNNKYRATTKYYKTFEEFADVDFEPKFQFDSESKFFTIGSCFARNVENYLQSKKIPLLSKMDNVSADYFKSSGGQNRSGYQNVYTPGSVLEASRLCLSETSFKSIVKHEDLYYDLMTHGLKGLPQKIAYEIHEGIVNTYQKLADADALIITLGYTEAWSYKPTNMWVNQSPADPKLRKLAENFEFHILNYDMIYEILREALDNFKKINPNLKFILTVSPVPLGSTFSNDHILIANQRSKSTLHSVAQRIWKENQDVDYFPSYEMVSLSDRSFAFEGDNIHVTQKVVSKIMERFFKSYFIN